MIVLAIRQVNGTMIFNPDAETEIAVGDFLIVMGGADGLRRVEHLLEGR